MNHRKENKRLFQEPSLFGFMSCKCIYNSTQTYSTGQSWNRDNYPQPNVLPQTILNHPKKGNFPLLPSAAFGETHKESPSADSNQESIQKGAILVLRCSSGSSRTPAAIPPLKL